MNNDLILPLCLLPGLLLASLAWSASLTVERTHYRTGETLEALVSVPENSSAYGVRFANAAGWNRSFYGGGFRADDPRSGPPYRQRYRTTVVGRGNDGRAVYYLALYKGDTEIVGTRQEIFVEDIIPELPATAVAWSFEDGARLLPGTEVSVTISQSDRAFRELHGVNPRARLIRLGRRMPGGAVEVDHGDLFDRVSYWTKAPEWGYTPQLPVRGTYVLDPQARTLGPVQRLDPMQTVVPREVGEVRHFYRPRGDDVFRYAPMHFSPVPVGHYVVRVLGRYDAVLAERAFEIVLPTANIAFAPVADGDQYDTFPALNVSLNGPTLRNLRVRSYRVDDHGALGQHGPYSGPMTATDQTFVAEGYRPGGPFPVGRYRVAVEYGNSLTLATRDLILDHNRDNARWPVNLEPPIGPDDLVIEIDNARPQVFGNKIRFRIASDDGGAVPDTGPLVAALYFSGHFTYGCVWRNGYYTGTTAILDESGRGMLAAPGEPGRYQVRVFRPQISFVNQGDNRAPLAIPQAVYPDSDIGGALQLIASASLDVLAPFYDDVLTVRSNGLERPVAIALDALDPQLAGHALELQLWYAGATLADGHDSVPTPAEDSNARVPLKFANGQPRLPVTGVPLRTEIEPIRHPGRYEVRLYDLSTGLFIGRTPIALHHPSQAPSQRSVPAAAHDDWPGESDDKRGVSAWRVPYSNCADPVFDQPPTLEVVHFGVDDDGNSQYTAVAEIWPGFPYQIQATFAEPPSESEYLVRVDGERRVRIYRTEDDPAVFRSRVISTGNAPGGRHE